MNPDDYFHIVEEKQTHRPSLYDLYEYTIPFIDGDLYEFNGREYVGKYEPVLGEGCYVIYQNDRPECLVLNLGFDKCAHWVSRHGIRFKTKEGAVYNSLLGL